MTRTLLAAALGAATLLGAQAALAAGVDHTNRITCYAYVHGQCFGGASTCSDDDYQWGLDQCDGYYPSTAAVRPIAPAGKLAMSSNREIRALIQRTLPRR